MNLVDTFEAIAPGIVALGSRYHGQPKDPVAPLIIGTGFIVDPRGVVVTAGHVARTLFGLPRHPITKEHASFAMPYTAPIVVEGHTLEQRSAMVGLSKILLIKDFQRENDQYYGEELPDLAFLQLVVGGFPSLQLDASPQAIRAGASIAYAGYPLGGKGLTFESDDQAAILVQMMPFVRHGIVSSVHPFPSPNPDGFTIDAVSQGGASGSPIFHADRPSVIGMLYAAVEGTNITFALPSSLLQSTLTTCLESGKLGEAPKVTYAQWCARMLADDKRRGVL